MGHIKPLSNHFTLSLYYVEVRLHDTPELVSGVKSRQENVRASTVNGSMPFNEEHFGSDDGYWGLCPIVPAGHAHAESTGMHDSGRNP